jgi:hypothetical protein
MSDKELKFKCYKFITLTELIKYKTHNKELKIYLMKEFPICVNLKSQFLGTYDYILDDKYRKVKLNLWQLANYKYSFYYIDININPNLVKIGLTKQQYDTLLELIDKINENKRIVKRKN